MNVMDSSGLLKKLSRRSLRDMGSGRAVRNGGGGKEESEGTNR